MVTMVDPEGGGTYEYTPPGHIEGSTPSAWELANQQVSPASANDQTSAKINAGAYAVTDAQKAQYQAVQEWRQRQAEQQVAQQQARLANASINEYGGVGSGVYGPSRSDDPFAGRADIYKVTDTRQQSLMDTGLTAGQAAEQLRVEAVAKGDLAGARYYETLRTQAWTTETGKSGAYHYAAKESGLAQAPNPYEYGADLFTYAEKGYPQNSKDRFSPVDYTQLGLVGGKGGQAYIWGNQNYDLRGAMDRVAYAQRTGEMGPYGQLSNYSSKYGTLTLEDQQTIGRYVNENPINQAKGFITKDTMGGFTDSVRNVDRGTFVPTLGIPTVAGEAGAKKPFISASVTEQAVYRPSDATLSAMSMWGGENSNPIARGMVTMYDFLTPGTKTTTGKLQPKLVSQQSVFNEGGAAFTPKFIGENGKPTDVMDFAKGSPYMKNGQMYQDYERVDLSKVWVTPTRSKTVETPSGFQRGQDILSNKAYDWLGSKFGVSGEQARTAIGISALTSREIANYAPTTMNIATNMGVANIKETFDKPAEAGIWFGVGLALGGGTRVAETAYGAARASVAESVISNGGWRRTALQTSDFMARNLPKGLAGMYAIDVGGRSTDWGTNLKPGDVSAKGSTILIHEAIPMAGGTVAGYYAPELASFAYRSAVRAPGEISDAIWTTRQRMAGITRVEPGTLGYDFTATAKPIYEVPRSAYPSSSPAFDNSAGMWSWGGVRTAPPETVKTVDVTPTLDLQTGKWQYVRPENIATPGEQKMIVTQYKLTPKEIKMAKKHGYSLNDILNIREQTATAKQTVQSMTTKHSYDLAAQATVMELQTKDRASAFFGTRELVGNNLIRQLYPPQEEFAISVAGQQQQQISRPLFGSKELVGNNLIRQLYPPRQEQGIRTINLNEDAFKLATIGKVGTLTTGRSLGKTLTISGELTKGLTLPKTETRVTTISKGRTDLIDLSRTREIQIQRGRTELIDPLRTTTPFVGKGGGIGIPLLIPPWGGSGGSGWGGRSSRGRKLTQLFNVSFGDVTSPMFGGFGGMERVGRAPRTKKVYGNFRGSFTTATGKKIKVRTLPKGFF